MTRQCVDGRRFGDIETLRDETAAWSTDVNSTQRGVDWQMKIDRRFNCYRLKQQAAGRVKRPLKINTFARRTE